MHVFYDLQQQIVGQDLTTHEVTSNRRMIIRLDMRLIDKSSGNIIWHDRDMEEKAIYAVENDPLVNRFNQQQALQRIARQMAKRIFLKTMERF